MIKATRLISDGSLITSFPFSGDPGLTGNPGGYCPFEKLLLPGSTMEFLHASLDPSGHMEFDPLLAADFAPDSDKRYKVRTYSGSITVPDGTGTSAGVTSYYAKTTTDTRVSTYSLDYAANQTGWILTETGSRTVGERFVFSTGPDPPSTTVIESTVTATASKQGATVYTGDGITATISSVVIATEMQTWCQAKLDAMKATADTADSGVIINPALDAYHKGNLKIKIACARMMWTGSGMFDPLPGTFSYFVSPMMPDFELTAGTWKLAVSNEIPASEKYFDAAGMYGDATWWNDEHSLFGSDQIYGSLGLAVYPHSGIDYQAEFSKRHIRLVSLDGLKRRFLMSYAFGPDDEIESDFTTSPQDGFANATGFITEFDGSGLLYVIIRKITRINSDDTEVIEYGSVDSVFVTSPVTVIYKHRQQSTWGCRGFTNKIPPEGSDPPREPLDKYYKTITITSTGLTYAAKDNPSPPPFLTGMTATGEMSGSYTLTKPSEQTIGTLAAAGRWSRSTTATASPFAMDWTAAGSTGSYEIEIANVNGFIRVDNPPFTGSGDRVTITETGYQVAIPTPAEASLPVRSYRLSWPRVSDSNSSTPDVATDSYSLAAPDGAYGDEGYTTLQKSDWKDLGLPTLGDSWISEKTDEFAAFVGI